MALSVILSPVGGMFAAAAGCGLFSLRAWRSATQINNPDALAGLFQRDAFKDQLRDPKLRHIRARGQQRSVQGQSYPDAVQREAMLHQVAAVMRGTERDARIVRQATRYLAGEGFVLMENVAQPTSSENLAEIVEIEDFEEVKLLPPPSTAKAA